MQSCFTPLLLTNLFLRRLLSIFNTEEKRFAQRCKGRCTRGRFFSHKSVVNLQVKSACEICGVKTPNLKKKKLQSKQVSLQKNSAENPCPLNSVLAGLQTGMLSPCSHCNAC